MRHGNAKGWYVGAQLTSFDADMGGLSASPGLPGHTRARSHLPAIERALVSESTQGAIVLEEAQAVRAITKWWWHSSASRKIGSDPRRADLPLFTVICPTAEAANV